MLHSGGPRVLLAGLGVLLVLTAMVIDGVHADMLATFGRAQLLLLLVGSGLLFVALTWSRAAERYRDGAVILVTAVMLLLLAELAAGPGASLLQRFREPPVDSHGASVRRENLSYIASTDWGATFWPEHWQATAELSYQPYVMWRTAPFAGAMTNITPARFRMTPGAECVDGAYQVFVFGGSTLWGWGAPDWGTIPAYLQERMGHRQVPVCVVNMGQNGFVSTQEVIALLRVLQQDWVPDLVIVYDGFNEVHAAFTTGVPGVHFAPENIKEKLEDAPRPLLGQVLERSKLVAMLGEFKGPPSGSISHIGDPSADTLRTSIVRTYRRNLEFVSLLGDQYGFDYLFFWQPNIFAGTKSLNPEEQTMFDYGITVGFVPLLQGVHRSVAELADAWDRLYDLSDTFDDVSHPMWLDYVHLTPEGNRLIADRIVAALAERGFLVNGSAGP